MTPSQPLISTSHCDPIVDSVYILNISNNFPSDKITDTIYLSFKTGIFADFPQTRKGGNNCT